MFPKQSGVARGTGCQFSQLTQNHRILHQHLMFKFFLLLLLRCPVKSALVWPCHIACFLLPLSSKHGSSRGTFLGDQTEPVDLSLAQWQSWASCQHTPPVCLVFCNQASRVYCMLTMGQSGPSLRGCDCMLIYASSVPPNPFFCLFEAHVWQLVWHSLTLQSLLW